MQILDGIATATDGGWLYNESQNILSVDNRVILGKDDNGKQWSEISMEKKAEIEAQMYEDVTSGDDAATPEDYENALTELGVDFDA